MSLLPPSRADGQPPDPTADTTPPVTPETPVTPGPAPTAPESSAAKRTERAHPLTPLIRGWVVLLAVLFSVGRELLPRGDEEEWRLPPLEWLLLGLLAACLVAIATGWWSWLATRFVMDAEELRLDSGMVFRRSQRIAFARIQSIDVVQPFAARLFGLAELQIDLGGETAKLRYLALARAYSLRDYLLQRAHAAPVDAAAPGPRTPTGPLDLNARLNDLQAPDQVLVRIQPPALLLAAVTSHEFFAILLGGVAGVAAALWLDQPWLLLAFGIPTISALFGFVSRRIIGQFNYTLSRRPSGLRISRGLTTLTSQSLPARRVQAAQVSQSWLWRLLGIHRIDLEVLGWGALTDNEDRSGVSTIMLPCGDADQVRVALAALWPAVDFRQIALTPAPPRARWLHPFAAPFLSWGHDDRLLVVRRGVLVRRWQIVPLARVQSIQVQQGPVSRRLGLADLAVHTAGMQLSVTASGTDASALVPQLPVLLDLAGTSPAQDVAEPVVDQPQPSEGPEARRADQADPTMSSSE
ncbi:MAG TPA: PH domain-containing protein [Propionicimonas sp.]|nr:PH domain-containing protein [Propionicimonas sp.]